MFSQIVGQVEYIKFILLITRNYRQIWCPNYRMNLAVSSSVEVSMDNIAFWIRARVADWTAELVSNWEGRTFECQVWLELYDVFH